MTVFDWWGDFMQNWIDTMIPVENPKPYDAPDTPVFPPLTLPPAQPGDDGDRDKEDADVELPVPAVMPEWMDDNTLTPEQFRRLQESVFIQPDCADDLTAYHSHLCPCPACAEAESRRKSVTSKHFEDLLRW